MVLILVLVLCVLLAVVFDAMGLFGDAATAQVVIGFVVPALVLFLFWHMARSRIREHDESMSLAIRLERVQNRVTGAFLMDIAHELAPHRERCSAQHEAVAVAAEYQDAGADIKVAVPDVEIETDRQILRQLLNVLVGNALTHGGDRIAIWAVTEGQTFRLTVSDDGIGLPTDEGEAVFEGYVDLGMSAGSVGRDRPGLSLARVLAGKIGAEMGYKRDPSWSHFSVRLPIESEAAHFNGSRVPLEAGVR